MTGLIWFVQVVHYPLFAQADKEIFIAFEAEHQKRTTFVVLPVMLVELGSGVYLLMLSMTRDWGLLTALLGMIWLSTFLLQVPCHKKLESGYSRAVIDRLVLTNWIRTLCWTARSALFLFAM